MSTTPSKNHSTIGTKKSVDDVGFKQSARFPPYTIIFRKPQQNEQGTA
ncbi:unnamed protein product, partial [Rotaria sp. Silwood1]